MTIEQPEQNLTSHCLTLYPVAPRKSGVLAVTCPRPGLNAREEASGDSRITHRFRFPKNVMTLV